MNAEAIVWLVIAVFFAIAEATTVALVSAWFCIGALAAMAVAFLEVQPWVTICVFLAASALSLVAFRPLIKKHFNDKVEKTNLDTIIGTVGTVIEPIDNIRATGRVKLGGMEWSARSTADTTIPAGTIIKVDRIEGVKVFVTPTEKMKEETTV